MLESIAHDPLETLRRVWGFDQFLGLQEPAVRSVLEGRDTLVVFPTGGGKSITYQLPALLRPGTAVVVSPLIALMQDQVAALRSNGVVAAALNSALELERRFEVIADLRAGRLKLLYVSPESLLSETTVGLLQACRISFFAIDEAHCISHWGHDFRPEYRALGQLRELFGGVSIHACTATATPTVREDIARSLGLRDPEILVSSFDRPNLTYRFVPRANLQRQVDEVLARHRGDAGIIYCPRRADVDAMSGSLAAAGANAVPYHAGMTAEARRRNQDLFTTERADLVVATVAFGMGIDRSDVRFVIHTGMPKTVEHYQQEAGRAGRDGLPAECVLFHSGQDVAVWRGLVGEERVAQEKLSEMYRLCRSLVCRHQALLRYFGQSADDAPCGACDVCLGENQVLDDSLTMARKVLSGVARVRERFGARYVAEVLKGSKSAKIVQNGHDRLSTHGLLAEYATETIGDWIDQLIAAGHLLRGDGDYPVVGLTDSGRKLMLEGVGAVTLSMPRAPRKREKARAGTEAAPLPPASAELFEILRGLRRELAHGRGVPPYVIFSDASLIDIARRLPRSDAEFRAVKGVGDAKAVDLGPLFLPAIQAWVDEHPDAVAPPSPSPEPVPKPRPVGETRKQVFALFAEGASLESVATQLGRSIATIESYLFDYLAGDPPPDATPWIDPAAAELALPLFRASEDGRLKPIYEALEGKVPYVQLRLAKRLLG